MQGVVSGGLNPGTGLFSVPHAILVPSALLPSPAPHDTCSSHPRSPLPTSTLAQRLSVSPFLSCLCPISIILPLLTTEWLTPLLSFSLDLIYEASSESELFLEWPPWAYAVGGSQEGGTQA